MDALQLDDSYIRTALIKNSLGVLSTVSADGLPDAAVIYYIADYDFNLSFVTPALTQKKQNIMHQPFITLTIVNNSLTETIRYRGKAEEKPEMLDKTLQALAQKLHYGADFLQSLPVLKYKDQAKTVFHIKPIDIRLRRYTEYSFAEKTINFPQNT